MVDTRYIEWLVNSEFNVIPFFLKIKVPVSTIGSFCPDLRSGPVSNDPVIPFIDLAVEKRRHFIAKATAQATGYNMAWFKQQGKPGKEKSSVPIMVIGPDTCFNGPFWIHPPVVLHKSAQGEMSIFRKQTAVGRFFTEIFPV